MSYCRMGKDSDVYVYGDENHLICVGHFPSQFRTGSYQAMLQHLKEHRNKGDIVPNSCFDRLKTERELKGDIY